MRHPNLTKTLTGRLLLVGGLSLWSLGAAQVSLTPAQPASAQPNSSQATSPLLGKPAANAPASCALPTGTIPTQSRAVFVLDTSGSMRGIGDGKADIFNEVKSSVSRYVQSTRPDQVKLITFDSGVRAERSYALPAQEAQLQSDLQNLKADGNNTYLYRSMHAALSPLASSDRYVTNVFVMTDGIDNDPQANYSAQGALSSFKARGTLDSLAYIALGSSIPEDAKQALASSDYASGVTLPVGEVPDLTQLGSGVRLATVTDPTRVPVPFADGTPLALAAQEGQDVTLTQPAAVAGTTQLRVPLDLPAGSSALLCAPPAPAPNVVGPRTRRVLLKLQLGAEANAAANANAAPTTTTTVKTTTTTTQRTSENASAAGVQGEGTQGVAVTPAAPAAGLASGLEGLLWLNPGTSTTLAQGEQAVLRYRASPGLALDGTQLLLPAGVQGLSAVLDRQPGAREFAVRVQRSADSASDSTLATLLPGGLLTPRLLLPTGQVINLTPLQVAGLPTTGAANTALPVSPIPGAPGTATVPAQPGVGNAGQSGTTSAGSAQGGAAQAGNSTNPANRTDTAQPGSQADVGQEANAPTAQNGAATTGASQGDATQTTQTQTTERTTRTTSERGGFPWWLLLLGLLGLGVLAAALLRRGKGSTGTSSMAAAAVKGNRPPPPPKKVAPAPVPPVAPAPLPVAPAAPSRIEGVHYRDDRTLALIGLDGEVRGIPSPLSGPFDLGQVSRVADLRGLRAEQLQGGLQLVQIPEDLIVSQDTKLLSGGDLVAPGTLLSVIPAVSATTAARPSLGSLTGLGRPLMLRANGAHLEITGPYGDHLLNLTPGILDLGELLEAPALRGLRLSTRGYRILLTDVPAGLSVAPSGEHAPLKPGMYLPERTGLLLRGL